MLVTEPYSWIIKKTDYGGEQHFQCKYFVYFTMANKIQEQENTEECYINNIIG